MRRKALEAANAAKVLATRKEEELSALGEQFDAWPAVKETLGKAKEDPEKVAAEAVLNSKYDL